jgi:hypothetical protein
MRRYMLLYLKQLVISSPGTQEEELQAIINYLHTVYEVRYELWIFFYIKLLIRMIILMMFWI